MKRALIVKMGAIGDVVMAVPAVHRLHAEGFAIDWVANEQSAEILRSYPFVRVIECGERAIIRGSVPERVRAFLRLWKQLRGRYDLVATLYYDRRYRLLTLPVRSTKHVLLRHESRSFQLLPGRHHTDEFARLLLSAAGRRAPNSGPEPQSLAPMRPCYLPPSPLPPTPNRIVLAPGGARNALRDDRLRRWPLENYRALAELLLRSGYQVVLTGGPDDGWTREGFAGLACVDLIGQVSLSQLLALFDASAAVVTHDSGPLHMAGVTRCVLLGIFGPVNPWERLPRRAGAAALWGGEGFGCRPCYDGRNYAACQDNLCMAQVTPEAAFGRLEAMLQHRGDGTLLGPAVHLPPATQPLIQMQVQA